MVSDIRRYIMLIEDARRAGSAITDSPAFRAWFAGSKIVDERGEPLRLYHGTSKDTDFTAFKVPKNGAWFTSDPTDASSYASENDSQKTEYNPHTGKWVQKNAAGRVMPVYVKAVNPVIWEQWPDEIRLAQNYKRAQSALFDRLRAEGHDAIVCGSVVVVLGSPNQIKSAIGNKGTFNPTKSAMTETEG